MFVCAYVWLCGGRYPRGKAYTRAHTHTQDRRSFLKYAAKGCSRFDLNRSAWALESEVRQIGGLIYW